MNSRKSLYDKQEFYPKGAILKASFQGMRYQVEKWQKDNEEECFRAAIWPEPFCFEKTPEENKTYAYFPYTEEGLDDVYDWLCTQYDEKNFHGAKIAQIREPEARRRLFFLIFVE